MYISKLFQTIKSPEHRTALMVAMIGDAIQIFALPLFAAGGISPADSVLDAVMAVVLIGMMGWHWAFLPYPAGRDDPRPRSVSHLDSGGSIRKSFQQPFRRRGNPPAGTCARPAQLENVGASVPLVRGAPRTSAQLTNVGGSCRCGTDTLVRRF